LLFVDWWLLVVDYLPPFTPLLSPSPLPYGKPRRALQVAVTGEVLMQAKKDAVMWRMLKKIYRIFVCLRRDISLNN
jgi:hypothetical protein